MPLALAQRQVRGGWFLLELGRREPSVVRREDDDRVAREPVLSTFCSRRPISVSNVSIIAA